MFNSFNEKYLHFMQYISIPLEASYLPAAEMKEKNYMILCKK